MKNLILLFVVFVSTISCKTIDSDNEQIKKTVHFFLNSIKKDDTLTYKNIYKLDDGGDMYYFNFLKRNYSKINPNNTLLKNIKIKDTVDIGVHQKYVMFTLKKPNYKPFETNQDLRLYLMFWKKNGYNKIYQMYLIGDTPKWEDQKPLEGY
ncbi:hypothetical protein [Epilithonimonas vandammei]|uniref:Lipoprotein n=1 Tax=Epilithonimonas vandammei TaxID=2487072 RepID=A0A3G8Y709_9FLAO|nr:hypothetical protein [Epilithonimonas vandammei]AZI41149.1 hypothetical protein EIB74_14845 [Epilithonimonas vandammei]